MIRNIQKENLIIDCFLCDRLILCLSQVEKKS